MRAALHALRTPHFNRPHQPTNNGNQPTLQNVFVVTLQNRIWRSKDGGSSFEDITQRFNSCGFGFAGP